MSVRNHAPRGGSIFRVLLISALITAALAAIAALVPAAHAATRGRHLASECRDHYSARRDPANPLLLAQAPGTNPLRGANFFVDGPAHGAAAGAIARLLGYDTDAPLGPVLPSFSVRESWATFAASVARRVTVMSAASRFDIAMLAKIATEPEVQRVSSGSGGGGPGAIFGQTHKFFCDNFLADPGSVPIINTYFLHSTLGGCATRSEIAAYMPTFERRVNEMVRAIARRPVVLLLETDGIGSSKCMAKQGDLGSWLAAIRYEVRRTSTLPHAVVYVEGGYSDANTPSYTARALRAVDITKIRGFYTNDTHQDWTINEIHWGERIVKLLGGHTHFIVNTAQNGNGPLIPSDRAQNGNSVLCNPPGRGLGPRPTTATGFSHVDAFLWTSPPGNSSGSCNGGTPAGTFDAVRAIQIAADGNDRLGPSDPSRPY